LSADLAALALASLLGQLRHQASRPEMAEGSLAMVVEYLALARGSCGN